MGRDPRDAYARRAPGIPAGITSLHRRLAFVSRGYAVCSTDRTKRR